MIPLSMLLVASAFIVGYVWQGTRQIVYKSSQARQFYLSPAHSISREKVCETL